MENQNYNREEEKINKILELTEENNQIIKKMHRSQKIQNIFRNIYWVIILATAFGAYYFLQKYFNNIFSDYQNIKNTLYLLDKNATSNLIDLINKFK